MKLSPKFNGFCIGESIPPDVSSDVHDLLARHPGHSNAPHSPYHGVQNLFNGNVRLTEPELTMREDWYVVDRFEIRHYPVLDGVIQYPVFN
jgi:hypothetical protein